MLGIKRDRKGISPIIATILLILIAVAAISVLIVVFRSVIPKPVANACLNADISLVPDETCFNNSNSKNMDIMKVQIAKGGNDVNIIGVQFVFSYDNGDESNIQEAEFDPNSEGIFYFDMSDINEGVMPSQVSIAPIVLLSNEEENVCENSEAISISASSCPLPAEVNATLNGWHGCTDDAWCLAKYPTKHEYKCVKFPFSKQGVCCWNGFCSGGCVGCGGGGDRGGYGPSGCTSSGCNNAGVQCGLSFIDNCGNSCGTGTFCNAIPTENYIEVYQETANASSSTDTQNCGLNYSGSYSYFGWVSPPLQTFSLKIFDGIWGGDSFNFGSQNTHSYLYINYTMPTNAASVIWQVQDYYNNAPQAHNISIPSDCFNYNLDNKIYLKVDSFSADGYSANNISYYCLSSSGWKFLNCPSSLLSAPVNFYEEAVIWNVSTSATGSCGNPATCNYTIPGIPTNVCCSANIDCTSLNEVAVKDCFSSTESRTTWKEGKCLGTPPLHCQQITHVSILTCASGSCSNGECSAVVCTNTCSPIQVGARKCYTTSSYQTCEYNLSNGCYRWSAFVACPGGMECVGEKCESIPRSSTKSAIPTTTLTMTKATTTTSGKSTTAPPTTTRTR
jgi:flagellin-like protein